MGTVLVSAVDLLIQVIRDHSPQSKWTGAVFESFRYVENTNRGEIGEDFIRRYLDENDIVVADNGTRTSETDLMIAGQSFEIKTASEDSGGNFQFNHVRHDRDYDYLLCLGVSPDSIWFNAWRKGVLAEGKAGKLVRMAASQSVTFKLTKRKDNMRPIEELPGWVRSEILKQIVNSDNKCNTLKKQSAGIFYSLVNQYRRCCHEQNIHPADCS